MEHRVGKFFPELVFSIRRVRVSWREIRNRILAKLKRARTDIGSGKCELVNISIGRIRCTVTSVCDVIRPIGAGAIGRFFPNNNIEGMAVMGVRIERVSDVAVAQAFGSKAEQFASPLPYIPFGAVSYTHLTLPTIYSV